MPQRDFDQYRMNLGPKPKGKINIGYEASTGNDTPNNLPNQQNETTKRTRKSE
ncbi:hypothetical protein [Alkalihalobacillus sp. AL-G]|uniref:hypothetical protein n=1 Tax=Alkalihalobacillus sp. AL-G TaxID=2926399 RepID=UPI00272C6300|nr:hypothetical protein [Alkalihalobacillus sp. AL-G]WLD92042.1 hypothetical protein MOJ78_13495 [Alkalihalobacillus sp. AL-G]